MGESIITRKASGGAKINEIIKQFKVATGETITAGDFVDYVNVINQGSESTITGAYSRLEVIELTSTSVLIGYTNASNQGVFQVVTFSGNTISSVGSSLIIAGIIQKKFVKISSTQVMLIYRSFVSPSFNNHGTARILSISGTTVTAPGNTYTFAAFTNTTFAAVLVSSTRVLVAHQVASNYFGATMLTISGTTVGGGTTLNSADSDTAFNITLTLLSPTKAIAFYRYGGSNIVANVLTINDTTITEGRVKYFQIVLTESDRNVKGSPFGVHTINENYVLLAYNTFYETFVLNRPTVIVLKINGNNIESPELGGTGVVNVVYTSNVFMSSVARHLSLTKINNTKYLFSYSDGLNQSPNFRGVSVIIEISNSYTPVMVAPRTIVTTNAVSSSEECLSSTFIGQNKVLLFYQTTDAVMRILEVEPQIKTTTDTRVFGVAKTGGTAGNTIDVYVNE